MRVVRVYHAGRSRAQRGRERALQEAGVDLTLVVPSSWHEAGADGDIGDEPFPILELPVRRPGDVNRHRYVDADLVARHVVAARPDLVDLHEEPFSSVVHQLLAALPAQLPVVSYTAQNLDKRYPPPFPRWERAAYARLSGIYPCSRQAAAVVRARGYTGRVTVLPLGYDASTFRPGRQRHDAAVFQLSLIGRLVPEKGVRDAIEVLAAVRRHRPARLMLAGEGPEASRLPGYISDFGVEAAVEVQPWLSEEQVAEVYRNSHVVLVPSRATSRWIEQFGRAVVEAQACGAAVAGYASGTIPEVAAGAAWLAAEADSQGLSRAVARLAAEEGAWSDLVRRGQAAAADKAWPAVADRQAEFYRAAVGEIPRPPRNRGAVSVRAAREEFGASARNGAHQARPFALPLLRDAPALAQVAGGVIDVAGRLGHRRNNRS